MELLRLSRGARRLGVHPVTLRLRADGGKIPVTWVGRERRFSSGDIDAMKVPGGKGTDRPRLEGLCVRVSGTTGQDTSPPGGSR
jgi:putative resolvase